MAIAFPTSPTNGQEYTYQGKTYTYDSTDDSWTLGSVNTQTTNQLTSSITFVIDGGGSAITTGFKGYVRIPFACTINGVTLLLEQSGSIVVDIWKDTLAAFPPVDADSITASAVPTVTTATNSEDTTLTGWATSITAGDVLGFNVDSITTTELCTVILDVTKGS